jgi:hypothetical protein
MEQKRKWKCNVVDVIAVVLIVAALGFVGWKLAHRGGGEIGQANTVAVTYTVKCEGVDAALFENCKKHLPSQLMASGELYDGKITDVRQEPYQVLDAQGQWVEDPAHVTLYFTVEANVARGDVMTTEIAKQEVRVGKSDYILKSEYIEFSDCVITDVQWAE